MSCCSSWCVLTSSLLVEASCSRFTEQVFCISPIPRQQNGNQRLAIWTASMAQQFQYKSILCTPADINNLNSARASLPWGRYQDPKTNIYIYTRSTIYIHIHSQHFINVDCSILLYMYKYHLPLNSCLTFASCTPQYDRRCNRPPVPSHCFRQVITPVCCRRPI